MSYNSVICMCTSYKTCCKIKKQTHSTSSMLLWLREMRGIKTMHLLLTLRSVTGLRPTVDCQVVQPGKSGVLEYNRYKGF